MKHSVFIVLSAVGLGAVALAVPLSVAVGARDAPSVLTVALKQQNRSGQSGTATLTERADGTTIVRLRVTKPVRFRGSSQMAHIHSLTCARYARLKSVDGQSATIMDGLSTLHGGRSMSFVYARLASRMTGRFSINVHAHVFPHTTVVCGDIPTR